MIIGIFPACLHYSLGGHQGYALALACISLLESTPIDSSVTEVELREALEHHAPLIVIALDGWQPHRRMIACQDAFAQTEQDRLRAYLQKDVAPVRSQGG